MRVAIPLLLCLLLVQPTQYPDQYGGTLRLGYTTQIQTLDPHRINIYYEDFDSSISAITQIFEGLVSYKNGTAKIESSLAKSWDISEDGLVYTFHLRKNVYFHDNNPIFPEGKSRTVTADDITYSWNRVTNPDTMSPMKDFFTNTAKIKSWKSTGKYTFEVILTQPNPAFLYMLPFPCFKIVPREIQTYPVDTFSSNAVGTGPFKVKTSNPLVLQYNEDYWKGESFVSEIEYHIVSPDEIATAFENETIDWCQIPTQAWDTFPQTQVVTIPRLEILYIGMNCQKAPFTNPLVRKAINYALDPGQSLTEIYDQRAVRATSILPPGLVCHHSREDMYPQNTEKAAQLLDQAGYTGNPRLTLELKSSESYIQQQFNEIYKQQLRDVNIDLDITYLDLGSLLHAVDTGDTQMFTLGWYVDWPYPDQFLFLFHSSGWGPGGNGCFYTNDKVDTLLEKAGTEPDIDKACSLYQKAEEIVLEDAVWVLQWRRVDGYAVQEWINGFNPGPMGDKYQVLNNIWISKSHRQTTRIPTNIEGENQFSSPNIYIGMGIGIIIIILITALVLSRK